jgi:hypothetical protein
MSIHEQNVRQAEMLRQTAKAAALLQYEGWPGGGSGPGTTFAAFTAVTNAIEVQFYRTCLASAIANGQSPSCYIEALKNLGGGS